MEIWFDDISVHGWKFKTHACQNQFAQNNGVELIWPSSDLANPCQNKASKQTTCPIVLKRGKTPLSP